MADVTVVIPFHGACPFLAEALASISAEPDVAVVLVNDRASDESLAVAVRFCEQHCAWRIVEAEEPGLAGALRTGIAESMTPYIARLDADDRVLPGRFVKQHAYLERNPHVALVGSQIRFIDEGGGALGCSRYATRPETITRRLRWECPVAHPSVMMRKATIEIAGSYRDVFDESGLTAEDYDLWIRMRRLGEIHVLAECLTEYRLHPQQSTRQHSLDLAVATLGVSLNAFIEDQGGSLGQLPIPLGLLREMLASPARRAALLKPLRWRLRRQFKYRLLVATHRASKKAAWLRAFPAKALLAYPDQVATEYSRYLLTRPRL